MTLLANAANIYKEHGQMPGSLQLAYLGDAIYEVYIRFVTASTGGNMIKLNKASASVVCAHAQSEAFLRIEDKLTSEEKDVAQRAQNAKQTPPKNADTMEYHRATAIEAVLGYLAIKGEMQRIDEIMREVFIALGIRSEED